MLMFIITINSQTMGVVDNFKKALDVFHKLYVFQYEDRYGRANMETEVRKIIKEINQAYIKDVVKSGYSSSFYGKYTSIYNENCSITEVPNFS